MNRIINGFLNFFKDHPIVMIIIVVVIVAISIGGFSWFMSRKYDKDRLKYEAESKAWATERAGLIANAEMKEKQVAELESQVAAFRAAAEQGKKVDDALAAKIDEVSKAAADEAALIDAPADCWDRGQRTCSRLADLKPPIVIDCEEYKRKICSR